MTRREMISLIRDDIKAYPRTYTYRAAKKIPGFQLTEAMRHCKYWHEKSKIFRPIFYFWHKKYMKFCYRYGFEANPLMDAGGGMAIFHPNGILISYRVSVGKNFTIRAGSKIGMKALGEFPTLGDNVDIGINASIVGKISIGNGAVIGAGAVVVKDVPDNAVVAGNPAKIIKYKE